MEERIFVAEIDPARGPAVPPDVVCVAISARVEDAAPVPARRGALSRGPA